MSTVRVIPRLDIKGPNLVKGIHLEGLRVMGSPEDFAKYYYESGADELIYQDVVASLFERNSLKEFISRTAKDTFIPLTVGGGLRTLDDISAVLAAGADKVSINTAAIRNPDLISQAALRFGSSTIVVAIESIRQPEGTYLAYTDNGREHTGVDAIEWARTAEKLGAGEILATSVDRDGTGDGYDHELTKNIADAVSIPVIAHGGAGCPDDVAEVIRKTGVAAVAVASVLHYDAIRSLVFSNEDSSEGNTEFLRSGKGVARVDAAGIAALKQHLLANGVPCRMEVTA
ncbi:MAG TPA: imidazole glycerol phosphate synthase subunit HisF [Planctomycetes bacterium]|nr:imidazole glycerol phosphate synthase subunit HisF [Fuerstiella sp.]HIK95048.1 imidazole glycerol phosphate synthase subunit HisF [Planctomycetota bacterium]